MRIEMLYFVSLLSVHATAFATGGGFDQPSPNLLIRLADVK